MRHFSTQFLRKAQHQALETGAYWTPKATTQFLRSITNMDLSKRMQTAQSKNAVIMHR